MYIYTHTHTYTYAYTHICIYLYIFTHLQDKTENDSESSEARRSAVEGVVVLDEVEGGVRVPNHTIKTCWSLSIIVNIYVVNRF